MEESNEAKREVKTKILAEAYDLLMLSPEDFMRIYYVNIAGQKVSKEPDNEAYYLHGQTLKYALSMGIHDDINPPIISIAPCYYESSDKVYSPPLYPYVALMNKEEDVAYDDYHLNNLPYLRLSPGSNNRLMVTPQLSGCTMCSWQMGEQGLLVSHIQPAVVKNNEEENEKEKEPHKSQAYLLQSKLRKEGGFIGHQESIGQLTCFGARNYQPQRRNKANILGWCDGDGNWHLTVQINNPGTRKIIDTFPLHTNDNYLKPQKPQIEPKEHPYKGPDFRNL